jgi:phosphohistidine phosphatase
MSDITVYFAQHGLAVDKTIDPARPLSDIGIEQSTSVAQALYDYTLRDNAVPVTHIFHSGKLRAAQTAEIFASVLQHDSLQQVSISAVDYLSPNGDVKQTAKQLVVKNALYVGHLPHLEKLTDYLICGVESSDEKIRSNTRSNVIKFSNSAVACLQLSGKTAQLHWYLTPELTATKS